MSQRTVSPKLPFTTKLGYGVAELSSTLTWTMVSVLFLFYLTDIAGSEKGGWSLMAAIFGFCAVFPILITWRATRGGELHPEGVTIRLRDVLDGPLKNRTFLYTMGLYAAASVGLSSAAATMVYFMKYYMNFNETQESLAFLFLFACTILWIPVINKLSGKYGKREAYMIFIGLWVVIQAVGTILLTPSMTLPYYAMMVVASGGVMSISMTIWAMIPDAVEVDELKCGQRREGLFFWCHLFCQETGRGLFYLGHRHHFIENRLCCRPGPDGRGGLFPAAQYGGRLFSAHDPQTPRRLEGRHSAEKRG